MPDHGPSLIGVGEAAVYFQVSTGRMPAMRGEAQAQRKEPIFDEAQIDALGAYVQANGAGPPWSATRRQHRHQIPAGRRPGARGDLFRLNCASCHNFTGKAARCRRANTRPTWGPPMSSKSSPRC
ncbi:menaquinol-cytochrome c reductase cytochrome c subunit [Mycobacterium kansasii]|uniref:Menaquinol-cytochrome c reductase cytochrome c subunit n=1 Tax=Mycobacterium kansasii TaxID=1768 RepID=A0A1V3WYH5_MYCKA|nr:menaquinol-cytochrome c reductase cytochrome c subunit [Mycobacterium kansasii]